MYEGMIETRSLQILLKSFHENYSDLFKKQHLNSVSIYSSLNLHVKNIHCDFV